MRHIEVVAAILIYQNQILCMQRGKGKHDYTSYKYEFPGGKIEAGESQQEALQRELKEELDLTVQLTDLNYFMTVEHTYPDFKVTLHTFIYQTHSKEVKLKEHIDYQWTDKNALETLDWAAADYPILKKLKNIE